MRQINVILLEIEDASVFLDQLLRIEEDEEEENDMKTLNCPILISSHNTSLFNKYSTM